MFDNCSYNKIKLLHELSCLVWFMEKHALKDAQVAGDSECQEIFQTIKHDLDKHLERLHKQICKISQ